MVDNNLKKQDPIRAIAFYLPQFYPNPQNNEWWGNGFTEWTNVAKAKPLFKGHYQPHLPADLGYYDLRLVETREAQAAMAREHGIHGFCYYHYWFHGDRMLDRVFSEVLASGTPDMPFCLCWANESWTRVWIENDKDVLLNQTYSKEDDLEHIRFLIPAFKDPRYIRINGRPLFLIYRAPHLEHRLAEMLTVWNKELEKCGLPEPYLCSVRTPPTEGFEANVDFFPRETLPATMWYKLKWKLRKKFNPGHFHFRNRIADYSEIVANELVRERPNFKSFLCPVTNWDNSPRRGDAGSIILTNSTPSEFRKWFSFAVESTLREFEGEERIVFINAWNEWAEGAHLEPDQKWGLEYLRAVRDVLKGT